MIHIEAFGGIKKDRELAEEIAWFCIETLMPRHKTLMVDITLRNTKSEGAYGFAHMGDDEKEFCVDIDHKITRTESVDLFIETVCHEMVHVWQMATKRMKDTFRGGYRVWWKCTDGKYRNYTKILPWETQAYALEGKLAELFKLEFYGRDNV